MKCHVIILDTWYDRHDTHILWFHERENKRKQKKRICFFLLITGIIVLFILTIYLVKLIRSQYLHLGNYRPFCMTKTCTISSTSHHKLRPSHQNESREHIHEKLHAVGQWAWGYLPRVRNTSTRSGQVKTTFSCCKTCHKTLDLPLATAAVPQYVRMFFFFFFLIPFIIFAHLLLPLSPSYS